MKIVKTYESFVEDKKYKFEENVIDPILTCIRDNQEFLTQPENLPQLAKLGYMYNTLWYAGRVCWGYSGILLDSDIKKKISLHEEEFEGESIYNYISCEENPKYKIEMCNPQNEEIENLIYDAWGMHVSDGVEPNSKEFFDMINNGKPLSELDKKLLKINKTMDDWVEIKTDKNYRYKSLYSDRKSVLDNLLCTIGTGYGFNKDGFIIEEASGADQDKALYGDWSNAKFSGNIKKIVDNILSTPQVKRTLDTANSYLSKIKKDREEKEKAERKNMFKGIFDDDEEDDYDEALKKLLNQLRAKKGISVEDIEDDEIKEDNYHEYYPISSSSSIYIISNEEKRNRMGISKIDQSYIDASIEICKDILEHEGKEKENNIKFARMHLLKLGFKEYEHLVPKEVDKYAILNEIEDSFLYLTDTLNRGTNPLKKGEYMLYLNDTKNNDYADNNYYFSMSLDGYTLPKGFSNHIDFLKGTNFYTELNQSINRISHIKEVKHVLTYCSNTTNDKKLDIQIIVNNNNNFTEKEESEKYLEGLGFNIGLNQISYETKDYILTTAKPEPFGKSHPNNKNGNGYYNVNKSMYVLDKNWRELASLNIDERGFNIISGNNGNSDIKRKIISEYNKLKASDPKKYGAYDNGTRKGKEGDPIYVHDFMIWLKNNGL